MIFLKESLTVVLLGDWNRFYIQPEWVVKNVFEKQEMEIGINGQGFDFTPSYRSDSVIINPGQNKTVFSVLSTEDEVLMDLCKCLNNFVEKAFTPQIFSYGFNADFVEEDSLIFADVLDSISDNHFLVNLGYEVVSTKIERTLKSDDRLINIDFKLKNNQLLAHFNQHVDLGEAKPKFCIDDIKSFIEESSRILCGLGYDMEGDE